MQFKRTIPTKSVTAGVNTCEYIILHHTATARGTINGVLNYLSTGGKASCHYVVDTNGDAYKIGNDKDILWHAGVSSWQGRSKNNSLNAFSIGIEVIGPLENNSFTDEQRNAVASLIKELAAKYGIQEQRILRHKDIAPWRKNDILDTFWSGKFKSWELYRSSLFPKIIPPMPKTKYTDIMETALKESGLDPIFASHEGDYPLKESETKELIEIALARFFQRIKDKLAK